MGGIRELPSDKVERGETLEQAVECDALEPIRLTEHTAHAWTTLGGDAPVADAVAQTLVTYREG